MLPMTPFLPTTAAHVAHDALYAHTRCLRPNELLRCALLICPPTVFTVPLPTSCRFPSTRPCLPAPARFGPHRARSPAVSPAAPLFTRPTARFASYRARIATGYPRRAPLGPAHRPFRPRRTRVPASSAVVPLFAQPTARFARAAPVSPLGSAAVFRSSPPVR